MKKIHAIILLTFLTACSSIGLSSLPSWYLHPPKNNVAEIYGVGYGVSPDQATKFALNNISERISVTVSSNYEDVKQEARVNDQAIYEQNTLSDIKSQTQEIEFKNYEILKSLEQNKLIYVLLKVAREDVVSSYIAKIEKVDERIDLLTDRLSNKSVIDQLSRLNEAKPIIAQNRFNIEVTKSLNKNAALSKYITKYKNLLAKESKLRGAITIKIISKPSDKKVSDLVAKNLNDMHIKVSNNLNPSNKNHIILRVDTQMVQQKVYQSNMVNIDVNFKLMENFGSQIAANKVTLKGSSVVDSVNAVNQAINSLQGKINEQGLFRVIGLK
jgi:hypothetical protein